MREAEKIRAYLAWGAVCFFWGTTYLAISIGAKTLPVALFSGSRFALAGAILLLLCRARGLVWPQGREWLHLGLVGTLLITCGNTVLVWSAKHIPSGMMALLVATAPFWMAWMEARSSGLRLGMRGLLGIALGFVGLLLLVTPNVNSPKLGTGFLFGAIALQFGCMAWCAGSLYSKRYPVKVHSLVGAAAQMLLGGLVLTVYGSLSGEWAKFHLHFESAIAYIYLVIFGSIIGYGSYMYALQKLPAAKVSTYAYINPVIAVLLGWLWLHERLDWQIATSMVIILVGVALVKTSRMYQQPHSTVAPEATFEESKST
ncbi:MAG: EamA family transporter [Acidobacteriota bacterium]